VKDWFESAPLVENAAVEIAFLLRTDFYYGPDGHQDITEKKLIAPLGLPEFPRVVASQATTREAEHHTDELIRYYADIIRFAQQYSRNIEQVRHYFWLRLYLSTPSGHFDVAFPYYDTLAEIAPLLLTLINPPSSGEVLWDRDQCWELDMIAHDGMLYVREWDPDGADHPSDPDAGAVHALGKLPLQALAASSKAALERARRIVATLNDALGVDLWSARPPEDMDFQRLMLPVQASGRASS